MSAPPEAVTREQALEQLRGSLHAMLTAHRRLRSRDSRHSGGIGFAQYRLLAGLRLSGGQTASALASAAELSPATVTEMLDGLAHAGLVERRRDELDRRIVRVELTRAGRQAFDAKQAVFQAALAAGLDDLDVETLERAATVLDRLAAFFEDL